MIATLTFSFAPSTEPGTALKAAVEAAKMSDAEREAAGLFGEFVQEADNQERVLEYGFRPGNPEVAIGIIGDDDGGIEAGAVAIVSGPGLTDLKLDDAPARLIGELLKDGAECTTGAAPWGPEVHQYGFKARLLDHCALEGGASDTADLAHVANSETRHNALLSSIGSAHHFSTGRREDDEVPGYLGDRNYAHNAEHRLRVLAG